MAAIDWYGPLIDLSQAASHIGDYVQLLVFVHRFRPIQRFKKPNGGGLLKTDVQVGDDTRPYFSVSIWQKHMGLKICVGDIVLLQNVKIVKFEGALEASAVYCSSLLQLIHPFETLALKDVDELLGLCQVGRTTKEKLKKVICWVQKTGSLLDNFQQNLVSLGKDNTARKNWKSQEEIKALDFKSISEVFSITDSCNVTFYAHIGEIFLPFMWKPNDEFEKEKMFVSKRLSMTVDNNVVEDLICTGCKSCGSPIDSRSSSDQNTVSFYCPKSWDHVHIISLIYRPFLLYVWDHTEHIALLVKDKAAELLFGSIAAESVYACYHRQRNRSLSSRDDPEVVSNLESGWELQSAILQSCGQHPKRRKATSDKVISNFHGIWLILLKLLLQHQGKNSPLRFEVAVNNELEEENGRFELINLTMPCYESDATLV